MINDVYENTDEKKKKEEDLLTTAEYTRLLFAFLKEEKTITAEQLQKLKEYEENKKKDALESSQSGISRQLSTPAGRLMSSDKEKESGLISSILIIIGAIALGVGSAYVLFTIVT